MHAVGTAVWGRKDLRFLGSKDLGLPGPHDLLLLAEIKRRRAADPRAEDENGGEGG
jgi:hypothetical protein